MDDLESLPPVNTKKTPLEKEVMREYFGCPSGSKSGLITKISWKQTGFSVILFVLISVPFFDTILQSFSVMQSWVSRLGVKIALFVIGILCIQMFL